MTERDLENLGKLPVPAPREAAKRAAINAALAAFDASTAASALAADSPQFEALGVPEAPNQQSPQGNVVPLRQTETSPTKRSFLMRLYSRPTMALAASLTALMIAAPLAFRHVSGGFKPMSATVPAKTVETDGSRMRPAEPQITEARPESGAGR